jgi:hypothetical protein
MAAAAPSRLALARNPISFIGAAVTTASALVFLALFLLNITGFLVNPYVGLLIYVALPMAFLVGRLGAGAHAAASTAAGRRTRSGRASI